ncbi:MAG TPA: aconitase/3-isopropylmalate dehydratase large subunit family protein, partial [Candidatus Thermoplasmatota archaeon]|nr:aconitase/3-isopropylmalate dehydratase large subunit family protein [Candidatus Thermoplasmatota archaeon]
SENGYALPGELVVGADSHSVTYGAFGAFGVGVGATEMAGVWATGEIWLRVPSTLRVEVDGRIPAGVTPKDLTLAVNGMLGTTGADYRAIEYHGSGVRALPIHGRMTLCNMGAEMGAKVALVPPDAATLSFLETRAKRAFEPLLPDPGARYERSLTVNAGALEPMVSLPGSPADVVPVGKAVGTAIQQAFLGSCTNGRLEDLADAAAVVAGRRVAPGVRFLVTPASRRVYVEAVRAGYIETLLTAGATVLPPGCGPCLGGHQGILAAGEVAISSANRNFRGRMGDPDSRVFLGSPATVAASAVAGAVADPRPYLAAAPLLNR